MDFLNPTILFKDLENHLIIKCMSMAWWHLMLVTLRHNTFQVTTIRGYHQNWTQTLPYSVMYPLTIREVQILLNIWCNISSFSCVWYMKYCTVICQCVVYILYSKMSDVCVSSVDVCLRSRYVWCLPEEWICLSAEWKYMMFVGG